MKQKVLVLGATGNLGANIAVKLKADGYDVVACGHRKSDNGFFASKGINYHSVDICDIETLKALPYDHFDAVAHFAGELPSRYKYSPTALIESITVGTLNVLEYMRTCVSCKKIIFPQSPYDLIDYIKEGKPVGADLPRVFPKTGDHAIYVIAKNAAIDLIEHYHYECGFSRFILRFFTIYQYHPNPYHYRDHKRYMMPYRGLMDKAMKGEPIEIWGNCKLKKEMVYIKDFTQLVENCVESPLEGGIYNVGNGWQVSLEEQIKGIVEVFSPADHQSPISYAPEKPDPLSNAFDISKTKEDLHFEPKYSYIDALRDFKHEMETEPFALLWGHKEDYHLTDER